MENVSFTADVRDSVTGRPVLATSVTIDGVAAPEAGNAVRSASVQASDQHVLRFERAGYLPFTWTGHPAPGERLQVSLCPTTLRVVAFGDSITAGLYVDGPDRYTAKLGPLLQQQTPGLHVYVYPRGVVGDTYVTALNRLQNDVLNLAPDVTLVELGTNDAYRTAQAAFPQTMQNVLGPLTRYCHTVLVADIPYKPRWYGTFNEQTAPFNDMIHEVAAQYQATPVSLHDRFKSEADSGDWDLFYHPNPYDFTQPDSVYQGDIHPNPGGHELMAEVFAEAITHAIAPRVATGSIRPWD